MRDLIGMDQREFNRQMGSYLKDRKDEEGFWARVKKKLPSITVVDDEKEQEPVPEEVPVEQVQAVMRGESLPKQEEDEEGEEDSFEEYEDIPEEGFFERLSKKLFGSYEKSELLHDEEDVDVAVVTEYEPKPQVDDDVKEMLRACVRWINRLPPEDIQAIKREDEYREFKRLLDKYGLIKK